MKYHMKVVANETSFIQKFDYHNYKTITEFFAFEANRIFLLVFFRTFAKSEFGLLIIKWSPVDTHIVTLS